MRGQAGVGILAAGVLAIGGIVLVRGGEPPVRSAPVRAAAAAGSGPAPTIPPSAGRMPEPLPESPLSLILRGGVPDELPPDVLSGSWTAEGPKADSAPPAELALTGSQEEILRALLSERDAVLSELRERIAARVPDAAEAAAYSSRAREAQASFVASLRSALLPEQRELFEKLLQSGRWGGYMLSIPVRR